PGRRLGPELIAVHIALVRLIRIGCLSLWLTAGCTKYEPLRLSAGAVEAKLSLPPADRVTVAVSELRHPILKPLAIDLTRAISPDQAAVLAVVLHPDLRADRDARNLAAAQLLQAGLLPNPQLVAGVDFPHGSAF